MKINRHLIKTGPEYTVKGRDYSVKLLKKTGSSFTAEITNSDHKGKWTTVEKKDLKIA